MRAEATVLENKIKKNFSLAKVEIFFNWAARENKEPEKKNIPQNNFAENFHELELLIN